MRTGFSRIGNTWSAVAFNEIAPKDDAGRAQPNKVFSENDIKLIVKGVLNACDLACADLKLTRQQLLGRALHLIYGTTRATK